MNTTQSTWSPFQSPEVREICEHLTPAEHAQLMDNARQCSTDIGWWMATRSEVAFGLWFWWMATRSEVAFGLLFWSWQFGLVLLPLFVINFAISGFQFFRAMQRRSMGLLCETEWARSRGYTPEGLRLMAFPWSK
ncbi:MAG: hypothetical protein COA78_36255 [Blastopirellula sp.]|nr:MAG: hypothetical protein COA78_36255 [Blastopirellula sp.]